MINPLNLIKKSLQDISDEKKYTCHFCGMKCPMMRNLKTHLKRSHTEAEWLSFVKEFIYNFNLNH